MLDFKLEKKDDFISKKDLNKSDISEKERIHMIVRYVLICAGALIAVIILLLLICLIRTLIMGSRRSEYAAPEADE